MENEDIKIVDKDEHRKPFNVASVFWDNFDLNEDHITALKNGKLIALNIMDEYIVYLSYKVNRRKFRTVAKSATVAKKRDGHC